MKNHIEELEITLWCRLISLLTFTHNMSTHKTLQINLPTLDFCKLHLIFVYFKEEVNVFF